MHSPAYFLYLTNTYTYITIFLALYKEVLLMKDFFGQECPEGVVQEDAFKEVYAKFFPHGSELFF